MNDVEKLRHCVGCEDNFYNGNNPMGVQRCWALKAMKIETRYQIGTWTTPDSKGAFTQVKVPTCYHAKGLHYYRALPSFVKPEDVNRA